MWGWVQTRYPHFWLFVIHFVSSSVLWFDCFDTIRISDVRISGKIYILLTRFHFDSQKYINSFLEKFFLEKFKTSKNNNISLSK